MEDAKVCVSDADSLRREIGCKISAPSPGRTPYVNGTQALVSFAPLTTTRLVYRVLK